LQNAAGDLITFTQSLKLVSEIKPAKRLNTVKIAFKWKHRLASYTRESGPDVVQGPSGLATSPTLLGTVLVRSQQNYLRLLLTVRYSKFSEGCRPATPPRGNAGTKMYECTDKPCTV